MVVEYSFEELALTTARCQHCRYCRWDWNEITVKVAWNGQCERGPQLLIRVEPSRSDHACILYRRERLRIPWLATCTKASNDPVLDDTDTHFYLWAKAVIKCDTRLPAISRTKHEGVVEGE